MMVDYLAAYGGIIGARGVVSGAETTRGERKRKTGYDMPQQPVADHRIKLEIRVCKGKTQQKEMNICMYVQLTIYINLVDN